MNLYDFAFNYLIPYTKIVVTDGLHFGSTLYEGTAGDLCSSDLDILYYEVDLVTLDATTPGVLIILIR
jgi:hypothetical protein